ncbi:permease prefix domain 1-containing protein [Fictibacillus sp. KU28468]|uniref:permease prefix domain 1-containing protein n=1 Tax=Fictibacillus sp. KU28468 TaxID=2991053 RepID=UPI00223D2F08|nr:permease prefix domain 1-containing protein [Fictibacillus sp. KU28468]UZJ78531.1 permease prefix domain 1-containing protein [Fictibacillus sp. KU28468]
MKQIDDYVNAMYRNADGNKKEINELKEEMKSHLLEAVYDWKAKGKSEKEAIEIALENFGDKKQISKGLSEFFSMQKRFSRFVLLFSLLSLALAVFFFFEPFNEIRDFRTEKEDIMNQALAAVDGSNDLSYQQKREFFDIYREHGHHLNHLAVFNVKEQPDLQEYMKENYINSKPDYAYPAPYQKAALVIGNGGKELNKNNITPSDYDHGTVVSAKNGWMVQYEYNDSSRIVNEMNNSILMKDYMDVYSLPMQFFVIFCVLLIVWAFLKQHHKRLLKVIS